jgi:hypothetical protein
MTSSSPPARLFDQAPPACTHRPEMCLGPHPQGTNPLFLVLCYWIRLQRGLQQALQDVCVLDFSFFSSSDWRGFVAIAVSAR